MLMDNELVWLCQSMIIVEENYATEFYLSFFVVEILTTQESVANSERSHGHLCRGSLPFKKAKCSA